MCVSKTKEKIIEAFERLTLQLDKGYWREKHTSHQDFSYAALSSIIIKNKHKHCEKIAFYTLLLLLLMGSKLLIDYPKAVVTLLLLLPSNVLIC